MPSSISVMFFACAFTFGEPLPQEDATLVRVKELIAVLDHPKARSDNLAQSIEAQAELVKIGAPAVPLLVDAAVRLKRVPYSDKALVEIGKAALPGIRAKWPDLSDEQRWRLMPVFEKHDPESASQYAWKSLESKGMPRIYAWQFMMRTKDERAKERYFKALAGDELPGVRWELLPHIKPIFDETRENEILINLLKADSWAAKGEGRTPPLGSTLEGWPDGRPLVVEILRQRKVELAASSILKILSEKGPGNGYLAETIIPALVDLKYIEAIPELQKIVDSKLDPEAIRGSRVLVLKHKSLQNQANEAIDQLTKLPK